VSRVLVLFAHPAFERSRVHRRLVEAARGEAEVAFHDLYEAYPRFDVDVKAEQARLEAHDVVVWQHPFFWYSVPALLKQWLDLVLEHGWAYGTGGTALRGKRVLSAVTTGGGAAAYGPEGVNRFPVRHFLAPLEQTARLCGMEYLTPFLVQGTHRLPDERIAEAARDYARLLGGLRDDRPDLEGLFRTPA
jgi:glutathione-regulated potassium-efflux system ancillary protein KefG